MSTRSSLLGGNYPTTGFQQIPELRSTRMERPRDATIDIPLTNVTNGSGARRADGHSSPQSPNEKATLFKKPGGIGGRRHTKENDRRHFGAGRDEDRLTHMGILYKKVLGFSVITRYFLIVLPLATLIAIPIIIGATAAKAASFGGVRIVWIFSWAECVWLSLWVSKLAAKALPYIFQFLCGIVSSGTRKYAVVLVSLEIPLSLSGWALASLATFIPIMTSNPDQRRLKQQTPAHWETVVNQILAALLFSSLIYLGEKFIVQLMSVGYHRQQYDAKIMESKHNIFLLGELYDASRKLFPAYCSEFAEEDYIINDSVELQIPTSHHTRSGSATPMRLLQNIGRAGDKITAAFGNVASEVTGKHVFNPTAAHSIVVEALEKKKSTEALARRIWMSFVIEGKNALYPEDIVEVLGDDRKQEAEEAFAAIDRDGNGDISLDEMILTVCDFSRERKSIANSLHDVDQAISILDNMLCFIVFIICVFIFVALLNSSFTTTLATAGTALLSLSFVFSTTAQEVLGSCIFVFVKHPFDVGDRVDINNDQFVVERISLLYTVFKSVTTHRTAQAPNIILNSLWINNVSRSKAMREQLFMYISFDTTLEDIQLLKNEMQSFVLDKENCRDFQPDIDVEVTGIASMDKLELKVEMKHKSNWSNEQVRAARRSKFMCALVLALRKIPVNGPGGGGAALGSSDSPSYTVAVSDAQAAAARKAFADQKDKARMIPRNRKSELPEIATSTGLDIKIPTASLRRSPSIQQTSPITIESAALAELNARHPANDPAHDWELEIGGNDSPSASIRRRSNDIEEVRDMLRRKSTVGKRKGGGSALSPTKSQYNGMSHMSATAPMFLDSTINRKSSGAGANAGALYHEYAASTVSGNGSTMQPITEQPDVPAGLSYPRRASSASSQAYPPTSQRIPIKPTYSPMPPAQQLTQTQTRRPLPGNNSFAQERGATPP